LLSLPTIARTLANVAASEKRGGSTARAFVAGLLVDDHDQLEDIMTQGLVRRGFGGFLVLVGAYPICTAVHLQNIVSGTVMFVAGVALYIWGSER
jgi:RPA family protein